MADLSFEPQATTFSLANARLLAQAAAVSYQDATACQQWAAAHGFDQDFLFFSSTGTGLLSDTQGFIAQDPRAIIVAFRGTQPNQPVDWLSDFQASHETWGHPVGRVHKGFYEALRAVWGHPIAGRQILPDRLVGRGDRTVWIAGHSLGGALAELCAAQAAFVNQVPIQGVYTFGQPRVGDDAFAQVVHAAFGTRIFRFINDRDIVPRVPFFGMGFRHYGSEIFFDHERKQTDGLPSIENLAAALQLARLAVSLAAVKEAAKMLAEATIKAGFHGNVLQILQELVRNREEIALGAGRALLAAGTANIADHSMLQHYLPLLGTSLTPGQNG